MLTYSYSLADTLAHGYLKNQVTQQGKASVWPSVDVLGWDSSQLTSGEINRPTSGHPNPGIYLWVRPPTVRTISGAKEMIQLIKYRCSCYGDLNVLLTSFHFLALQRVYLKCRGITHMETPILHNLFSLWSLISNHCVCLFHPGWFPILVCQQTNPPRSQNNIGPNQTQTSSTSHIRKQERCIRYGVVSFLAIHKWL